jgi:hypothetical protein
MTYPLARRNQPQWIEVGRFLSVQFFTLGRVSRLRGVAASGETAVRPAAEAAQVRSIPHGNHGDNLRSSAK